MLRVTPERVVLTDGRVFRRPGGAALRPGQRVIIDCRPGLTAQTPRHTPRGIPVMDTPFVPPTPSYRVLPTHGGPGWGTVFMPRIGSISVWPYRQDAGWDKPDTHWRVPEEWQDTNFAAGARFVYLGGAVTRNDVYLTWGYVEFPVGTAPRNVGETIFRLDGDAVWMVVAPGGSVMQWGWMPPDLPRPAWHYIAQDMPFGLPTIVSDHSIRFFYALTEMTEYQVRDANGGWLYDTYRYGAAGYCTTLTEAGITQTFKENPGRTMSEQDHIPPESYGYVQNSDGSKIYHSYRLGIGTANEGVMSISADGTVNMDDVPPLDSVNAYVMPDGTERLYVPAKKEPTAQWTFTNQGRLKIDVGGLVYGLEREHVAEVQKVKRIGYWHAIAQPLRYAFLIFGDFKEYRVATTFSLPAPLEFLGWHPDALLVGVVQEGATTAEKRKHERKWTEKRVQELLQGGVPFRVDAYAQELWPGWVRDGWAWLYPPKSYTTAEHPVLATGGSADPLELPAPPLLAEKLPAGKTMSGTPPKLSVQLTGTGPTDNTLSWLLVTAEMANGQLTLEGNDYSMFGERAKQQIITRRADARCEINTGQGIPRARFTATQFTITKEN